MKSLILFIFFFFIFKSLAKCVFEYTVLVCDEPKCSFNVINSNSSISVNEYHLKKNDLKYEIDLLHLDDGATFIGTISDNCDTRNPSPLITQIDKVSVNGGSVNFNGVFFFDRFGIELSLFWGSYDSSLQVLKYSYDPQNKIFNFNPFFPGCGSYEIKSGYGIFKGNYESAEYDSHYFLDSSQIVYSGSNFYNPYLKIIGTNYPSLTDIYPNITDPGSKNATFKINEIKYCGEWVFSLYSCNREVNGTQIKIKNYPIISGLTSVSAKYGGIVTIGGSNLYSRSLENSKSDTSGYNIKVYPKGSKDIINCLNITYFNEILKCHIPSYSGIKSNLNFVVIIDNNFTTSANFSFDKPSISSVNQLTFPTEGNANFSIKGKYLDDDSIKMVVVRVPNEENYKDFKCTYYTISEDEMIVEVPLNAYPGYIIIASLDGSEQINSNIGNLNFEQILYNVTKSNTIGEIITITGVSIHSKKFNIYGNGLEEIPITIKASDDGIIYECKNPISHDGIHLKCLMSPGVGNNLILKINISNKNKELLFSYNYPEVGDVKYTTQNSTTDIVSLPGNNFGNDLSKVSISNGKTNLKIVSVDHKLLQFLIPKDLNDINNLSIKIGSPKHENVIGYEFVVKPIISNISSTPLKGGIVTFTGRHLSPLANIAFRAPRFKPSSISCLNITVSEDRTRLFCEIIGVSSASFKEEGVGEAKLTSGANHTIYMTVKGREAKNENNITFSFEPPIIIGSSGKNGYSMGLIQIEGKNFNKKGLKIWIGDRVCKYPNVESGFETISCRLDSISKNDRSKYENHGPFDITVEVDGQSTTLKKSFNYTFNEQSGNNQTWSIINYAPGIALTGLAGLITLLCYIIYRFKRYLRIKKIRKILNKNVDYQNQYNYVLF